MAAALTFLGILLYLFFFCSFIPSIIVLPCYALFKVKLSRDPIFYVKHFLLWWIMDGFGVFFITWHIVFGDDVTLQSVLMYGALYLIIKVAIYIAIMFAKQRPLKMAAIVFITQLVCFAGASIGYTLSEEREPVPHYSNLIDFKGSVYIAISGDHLYKISKENELVRVAELPQKIIKPILSATQDELFMLGFRERRMFMEVDDKAFPVLFRLRDQQFVYVTGSDKLPYIGFLGAYNYQMDVTDNMLFIMRDEGYDKELMILEGEEFLRISKYATIGSTPKLYHGKWHAFHRSGYLVEFSWDPKAKDKRHIPISELEKVYGSESSTRLHPRLYVIDDVLYGARGSVLYRRDNARWREYVDVQGDCVFKDSIGDCLLKDSIYDVTGGNGFLFVDVLTGEIGYRIVKINSNKEMEKLSLPEAIDGKVVLIDSVLFKDDTLYASFENMLLKVGTSYETFEKLGVFALSDGQWKKVPIKAAKH